MADILSQDVIDELKVFNDTNCVSLYLPFVETLTPDNPNRIMFKNMLLKAEENLILLGAAPTDIKKTLRPAELVLAADDFWLAGRGDMVLFMHAKMFRYLHLPRQTIQSQIELGVGFDVEQLTRLLSENKSYLVLALGHKNVQLYAGDRYRLQPLQIENFPTNMKLALQIDEYPILLQTHKITPSHQGKGSKATQGHYTEGQTDKAILLKYFRILDKHLKKLLKNRQVPLILAGVDYLIPIYRHANTTKYLLPDSIVGNIEHTNLDTIRQRAWSLLCEHHLDK